MLTKEPENPYERQLLQAERCIIESALTATGSRAFAAAALGISDAYLNDRLVFLGIGWEDDPEEPASPIPAEHFVDEEAEVTCTACGAVGTVGALPTHAPDCPDQAAKPSSEAPSAPEQASSGPASAPDQASSAPDQTLEQASSAPTSAPERVSRKADKADKTKREPTEKQKIAWQAAAARARAAKEAKKHGNGNVVPFSPPNPVRPSPVVEEEATTPELPTFTRPMPFGEVIEGELAFCTCKEGGPGACPVHRNGGGRVPTDD